MKKQGRKPDGVRALTSAEKMQRQRAFDRIRKEELERNGCKQVEIGLPPIYWLALRESLCKAEPDTLEDAYLINGQICLAIEEFVERRAEIHPSSTLAKLFNSEHWKPANQLDFEVSYIHTKLSISKFIMDQNERISNEHNTNLAK
ncbi:hypothetical protein IVG45_03250 [Methylomonas sp. LL1]|uniref:hypothetical protein n=1 Tax=Methylomonas sp. LL1 TaxID=2785785 RepID=UPI0018C3E2A6|nr:hypothetical protein [Methylomonas sp. LL1]QPK64008.1 hypothetical protein IVG45_03250 [Methylomonas sp. LL1]